MGLSLWDIFGVGIRSASSDTRSSQTTAHKSTLSTNDIGKVLKGTVSKVAENYVLLDHGGSRVLIPKGELGRGREWVERTSDIVQQGQAVEFVLTEQGDRGWKGSVHAVDEAHIRASLALLQKGSQIAAVVATIKDKGVELSSPHCPHCTIWVPLGEISWSWIEHPAEAIKLGEQVEVEILRITQSDSWLKSKRARDTQVIGSIRACIEPPQLPNRVMTFSATGFRVCVATRVPPRLDSVVLFILGALAAPLSPPAIATLTGLPESSVLEILALLEEERLQQGGIVNKDGLRLLDGISAAETFSGSDVKGLFASAAPEDRSTLSSDQSHPARSSGWPRPVESIASLNRFLKLRNNALPEWLLSNIQASDEQRAQLEGMLANKFLSVFLSKEDTGRDVAIDVPERWLLAGLWAGFTPVDEPPFRPDPREKGCTKFLMARYVIGETVLYWEPSTCTLWKALSKTQVNLINKVCPDSLSDDMPSEVALRVNKAEAAEWCYASIKRTAS